MLIPVSNIQKKNNSRHWESSFFPVQCGSALRFAFLCFLGLQRLVLLPLRTKPFRHFKVHVDPDARPSEHVNDTPVRTFNLGHCRGDRRPRCGGCTLARLPVPRRLFICLATHGLSGLANNVLNCEPGNMPGSEFEGVRIPFAADSSWGRRNCEELGSPGAFARRRLE